MRRLLVTAPHLCAGILLGLMCGSGRGASTAPESLDDLVRALLVELPWYYQALEERISSNRSLVPSMLARKEVAKEMEVAGKRSAAAAKLKRLGTNAWPAVPPMIEALRQEKLSGRVAAAEVLGAIEADQSPAWTAAAKRLAHETNAAHALHWLLKGRDEFFRPYSAAQRRFALVGLAAVGPAARLATQEVASVLASKEDHELWPAALVALAKIGDDTSPALSCLRSILRDAEEWPAISSSAAQALSSVAPASAETLHALREALSDPRSLVRVRAARALWTLGEPPASVLPVLIQGTNHQLASIRRAALETLAQMGAAAAPAQAGR